MLPMQNSENGQQWSREVPRTVSQHDGADRLKTHFRGLTDVCQALSPCYEDNDEICSDERDSTADTNCR